MADLLLKAPIEYEPLLKNRFIVRFPSDLGIQTWTVTSCTGPKIKNKPVEIEFLNTKSYSIGKYEWESMTIKFKDFIGPSTAQALMEWMRLHSESVTGRQGYAVAYKRDLIIERLDPTGVAVSQWILKSCQLNELQFDDLSYNDDGVVEISANIQPHYCILSF